MTNKLVLVLVFFLFMFVKPSSAYALSCLATISPGTVDLGSSSLSYLITNQGPESVTAVKIISVDGSVFQISGGNTAGWSASVNGGELTFIGSTMIANQVVTFGFSVNALVESSPVSLDAYVSSDGVDFSSQCSGSGEVGVQIGVTPIISNVNLTVGNSSATLTWNTSVAATGTVNYGTTSGYGSSKTTASGTSHSATMSGLSASTTYNYQIIASGAGGTTSTANATFTTSAASVTTTTTTTVTNTVTNTATVNKTVILADTVKPVVKIETKLEGAVAQAPIMEGKIVDSGAVNVGIVKVQYSVDGGKSWLLVDEPSGASKVDFSFVPEVYEDGNYEVIVRATDKSGNTGVSAPQTLIIDRLPPRIIHSLWRVGPIILSAPYQLIPGVPVQVTVQGIGGITEMSLGIGEERFELVKNFETGLWEGEIVLNKEQGILNIVVKAKDGGGNEIEEEMGEVNIQRIGESANQQSREMTIYRYDELTKRFKVWNGEVYGQENPSTGKTSWYLPSGKYYIEGKAKGYKTTHSEIFELDMPGVVGVESELEKWSWNNFWKVGELRVQHSRNEEISHSWSVILGKQIKWIEKTQWRGKEIELTVVPMWEPRLAEILGALGEDSVVVVVGANQSSVELLKMRGGYHIELVGDPDGEILDDLKGVSLPLILKINRRGQVE